MLYAMTEEPQQVNPTKVRQGLAVVAMVVLMAGVLFLAIDDAFGKAIMFAVAAIALVRAYLLSRSLRKGT